MKYTYDDWKSGLPLPKGFDGADMVDGGWTTDQVVSWMREVVEDWPPEPPAPAAREEEPSRTPSEDDMPPSSVMTGDDWKRYLADQDAAQEASGAPVSNDTDRQEAERAGAPAMTPPAESAIMVRDRNGSSTMNAPGGKTFYLVENGHGRPVWCVENACILLKCHPEWRDALAYDDFACVTMLMQPVPGTTTPRSTFTPRPLRESDITAAWRWFNRKGFPNAKKNVVADALIDVAGETVLSPVVDYLDSLVWDGTPRVGRWLTTYCGAEPSALNGATGQAWLISAVARAFKRGCKVDCALVLEGGQGKKKSTALRVLAGRWFHDGLPDMHSKDASAALLGKWIIELPELSAMRKSDVESIKAFMSRREEQYRPAYARATVFQPRSCVFAGTTNRSDWLADDTGGRRFWPVVVGNIDIGALESDRDQLWAEAVALYRSGAQWWLDDDMGEVAAAVVAERRPEDPWTAKVRETIQGLTEVGTAQILDALGVAQADRSRAHSMRVATILSDLGWTKSGQFTSGPAKGSVRYVPLGAVDW